MSLRTIVIETLTAEMIKVLGANDIPFFIGGSRRFGYHTEASDIDMYIFVPIGDTHYSFDNEWHSDYYVGDVTIMRTFEKMGLEEVHTGEINYTDSNYTYKFMDLLHVIILNKEKDFHDLKEDHEALEEKFNESPKLLGLATKMKAKGLSGSAVFRMFRETLLGKSNE